MPPVSVANPPPGTTTATQGKTGATLPFTSSSWDHEEPFYDNSISLAAGAVNVGPVAVAAFGWMKGIWLRVTATGGSSSATVVPAGDGPWNIVQGLMNANPNGQPYFGPLNGYNMALVRRFGAYWGENDNPLGGIFSNIQTASGAGAGDFDLFFYIPAQLVDRNGLASLANENAKATYQLSWIQSPSSTVYGTPPGTLPTIRYRAYLEAWAAPPPQDILGNMTTQVPPGNGTIQFWTTNGANPVPVGNYNLVFTRKGQYVRNWIFIVRNSTGARDITVLTDPVQIRKDGYILTQLTVDRWCEKMVDWYALGQTGLTNDTRTQLSTSQWYGVLVYPFCADLLPTPGAELRSRYFPTLQATRLELVDTYAAGGGSGGGTVEIMTNDVAVPGDIFSRVIL